MRTNSGNRWRICDRKSGSKSDLAFPACRRLPCSLMVLSGFSHGSHGSLKALSSLGSSLRVPLSSLSGFLSGPLDADRPQTRWKQPPTGTVPRRDHHVGE